MYKQALISMIMVFPFAFCWLHNVPKLDITCSSDLMRVHLQFQQPFKGMVYAIDHPWDPACSFQVPPLVDVREITLNLPFVTCGTQIDYTPNGHSIVSNKIRVQQHSMLRTVNDTIAPISCSLLGLHESFAARSHDFEDFVADESNMEAVLEIDMGQDLLGSDLATRLNLFDAPILVFRAQNIGKYQDIDVKNCMIHESEVLGANSVIFQVIHPTECDENVPEIVSAFTIFNATNKDELVAYARLRYLSHLSLIENMHITCGAQLCRRICTRKCSKISSNDLFTAVATHHITKRSVLEEPIKPSSMKQPSDIRSRLLKATVRILSNRLIQKVEEEKSGNVSFHKRSEVITENNGQSGQEQMSFQSFIKDVTQKSKAQQGEPGISFEPLEKTRSSSPILETEISLQNSSSFIKLPKDSPKGSKKKLSERNRIMMKDLARKLASRSQKLKEHNEKFRDLIKTAKEENFPLNGFTIEPPNLWETIYTEDEVSTSPIDYDTSEDASFESGKIKRSNEDSVAKAASSDPASRIRKKLPESDPDEITTEDILPDVTEDLMEDLLSTSILQDELEQLTDVSISEIKDVTHKPTLVQTIPEDVTHKPTLVQTIPEDLTHEPALVQTISSDLIQSSTTEPDFIHYNLTEKVEESSENTIESIDHEQKLSKLQQSYKTSQLTFFIVTTVLSFIVFTLIVAVCGLVLYVKKEKKRRAIDNFLLYNFY